MSPHDISYSGLVWRPGMPNILWGVKHIVWVLCYHLIRNRGTGSHNIDLCLLKSFLFCLSFIILFWLHRSSCLKSQNGRNLKNLSYLHLFSTLIRWGVTIGPDRIKLVNQKSDWPVNISFKDLSMKFYQFGLWRDPGRHGNNGVYRYPRYQKIFGLTENFD